MNHFWDGSCVCHAELSFYFSVFSILSSHQGFGPHSELDLQNEYSEHVPGSECQLLLPAVESLS